MKVLVGYASAHGSTAAVAEEIGERLGRRGIRLDVRPLDEVEALDPYDVVVLGSAVHSGSWLASAAAFIGDHAGEFGQRPVWLFSVSSVGETSSVFGPRITRFLRRLRKEPKEVALLHGVADVRDHRNFAGVVKPEHWGRAGTAFLKVLGGTYGDHRDWEDLDAWSDRIARQVAVTGASN
jgi:menaquinone-dependent protoporphyrinogen oxidase